MATGMPMAGTVARIKPLRRIAPPWWTTQAWGAIGATALSLGITCWWLTQDRSVPVFDAGLHLSLAFSVYEELGAGHFARALTLSYPYPPFAYLVGDLGILFGGIGVAPPILAENLVFVPLLALGCYHVGRMAFGHTAGLLAVVFAFGSPLITAQFHVFMTDAPETAMVAVSLWAVLATDGFTRVRSSAAAGLAVGLGMLTKEPFAFFLAGPIAVTAIRGNLRAWRGLPVFALVAFAIAGPWYVHELTQVTAIGTGATAGGNTSYAGDISPAPHSIGNLEWYFWSMINAQLYAPLFAFSAIGWLWAIVGFARRRPVSRFAPELVVGAFFAWLAITGTFVHDTRYDMPLLVYLAVFGVGWIARLPRSGRLVASTALVLLAAANVAATSFGAGGQVSVSLPGTNTGFLQHPGQFTLYSNAGFLVSAPERDGDVLGTLEALKRNGITAIALEQSTLFDAAFSAAGMSVLTRIAGLSILEDGSVTLTRHDAFFHHAAIEPGEPPPCIKLADGSGIWIRLGNPNAPGVRDYCPSRHPQFYG